MEEWRRRVNEALDQLRAAQLSEMNLRQKLQGGRDRDPADLPVHIARVLVARSDAVQAARARVDAVLWE